MSSAVAPLAALLLTLMYLAPQALAQSVAKTTLHYDLRRAGLTLGQLRLTHQQDARAYVAEGRFRTTGLVAALRQVRFDMHVSGRVGDTEMQPGRYREQIRTGRRSSSVTLHYVGGRPHLISGQAGTAHGADPAKQAGTLDPMTALWLAATGHACDRTLPIFDGARRTLLQLGPLRETANGPGCQGELHRLDGYAPADLARHPAFALSLWFQTTPNGLRLSRGQVQTTHGPVVLHLSSAR